MRGDVLTRTEYVSYLVEGFVILFFLDMLGFSDLVNSLFPIKVHYNEFVFTALVVAFCFVLGQVNSFMAHWLLQEGMTALTLGRPSHYLLLGRSNAWIWYVRRLDQNEIDLIKWRWRRDTGDPDAEIDKTNERRIFSRAFGEASRSADSDPELTNLLMHFNFARNMTCAFIIGGLALFAKCKIFYAHWVTDFSWIDDFGISSHSTLWFTVFYVVVTSLLFLRYLMFLHLFTKKVLRRYGEAGSQDAPDQAQRCHVRRDVSFLEAE